MEPVLREFVGEYELTASIFNQRVVYKHINSSIALFCFIDRGRQWAWAFGNEYLMGAITRADVLRISRIHDIQGIVVTHFCLDVEYPANGECAYDWYYMPIIDPKLHVQIRGMVQCTKH